MTVNAVIDTAAQVSVLNRTVFDKMDPKPRLTDYVNLKGITKNSHMLARVANGIPIKIGKTLSNWNMVIADIPDTVLLGIDFLEHNKVIIDLQKNSIQLNNEFLPLTFIKDEENTEVKIYRIKLTEKAIVPPFSMRYVHIGSDSEPESDLVIHPQKDLKGLLAPHIICNKTSPIALLRNPTERPIMLRKYHTFGTGVEVEEILDAALEADIKVNRLKTEERQSIQEETIEDLNLKLPEHLRQLFKNSANNLTCKQAMKFFELLIEFQDIFAKNDFDLGLFNGAIKHEIQTEGPKPAKQKLRRTPLKFEKEEHEHIQQMLKKGIIQPSISDHAASPVLVRKKDGGLRYCIDYRPLNQITIKDAFPIANISDCLDTLRGKLKFLGKLVSADGVSVNPENIQAVSSWPIPKNKKEAGIDINSLPCGGCKFCRRAQEQWKTFEDDIDYVTPLAVRRVNAIPDLPVWIGQIPREEIQQCQLQDPDTSLLLTWLQENYSPSRNELQLCSPAVKHFWQCQPQLRIQDGILYYWWEDPILPKLLLVAPKALHREFLENCHSRKFSGHFGQDKTLARLKKQVVWHHMREDCLLFIKTCKICSMNKKPNIRPKAELGQYLSGVPMGRVHMDLLGPLPVTKQKNKYVLMIVDQFTKWLECFPIPGQTAEIVAKAAVDGFISRFGCPLEVNTDQGKNVDGNLMWNLCELLEISKTRTTAYHPASNGQVERYNRTVLQIIRCFLNKKQCEWDVHLQQLVGAIRATENRQTGFTPNVMMLGREVFHPIDLMLGTSRDTAKDPPEYIKQLKETLYEVHELARVNLQRAKKRQKKDYDLKTNQQKYDIGDIVLKINSATKVGQTPKFKQPWKGPYIVTEVKSPVLYKIQDKKTESVVHHDRLRMCYFTELPIWLKRLRNNILHDTDSNVPIKNEDSEDLDDIYDISGLFTNPDPVSDSLTSEPDINLTHNLQDITLESDTLTPDQGHRPVIQNIDELLDHSTDLDHTFVYDVKENNTETATASRGRRRRQLPAYLADYVQDWELE
ncbi:Hypothetical predicted protein [Mytilus galloprovincialis]|uniref:Integrase catalytic domain-containing protein n=1 Tax=Mytilus galloprovincialis TaxID=29158 RepID=A0A8B6CSG2_MYTGA|nr:Hypothetical predicted protein [Mytilus galloprovincialis]